MTLQNAHQQLKKYLSAIYNVREAENISNLVLENISCLSRTERLIKNETLSDQQILLLENYTKELLNHKPVQYVLHESWFAGLKFYIDESVLIPRPETEELVDLIVVDQLSNNKTLSVLDVGSGSGCIALAIKNKLLNSNVTAIDISDKAIAVASLNAKNYNLTIDFVEDDILQPKQQYSRFDVIVSNPPYIPENEKKTIDKNVLNFEPAQALFVPENDPLIFYKAIAEFSLTHLNQNGNLYFEIHEDFAPEIKKLLEQKQFQNVELYKDFQGKDRMVKATLS